MAGLIVYKRILCALLILPLMLFAPGPVSANVQSAVISMPDFQRGMCFVTWDKNQFSSSYSVKALEMLQGMGVEYLQVTITLYQDRYNSTVIRETDSTPSDASVKYVIKKAHDMGMKVMLKPHIDLIDNEDGTYWRADIGFSREEDWEKWFSSYKEKIMHYAKMSEKLGVEIVCVGTELVFASQKADYWRDIISSVRKVYSGKITYAANWDEYKGVTFWDQLDFVGIDAYFPLTYKADPTLEDIKEGWNKWKGELEAWHREVQKPIVFTEIGYSSAACAPSEPWKEGMGEPDLEIQANCYRAVFESLVGSPWLEGVYWWKWAPTIYGGGANNRNFTPLNKPAAQIVEAQYKTMKTAAGATRVAFAGNEVYQQKSVIDRKMGQEKNGVYGMREERMVESLKEKR